MRSITRLFAAFGTLADSILALSSVIDTVSAKVQLSLASEVDPPALAHAGEILDNAEPEASNAMTSGRKRKATTPA